ncbi:MAG: hypothetical protein LUF29_03505 [Oscillospiraceae bacterium]|nr:hypothetical protein [Oscillospiraceae bacterium]
MSTIEQTDKANPFSKLSADEILSRLAIGREQNEAGLGIPFDEAMEEIKQSLDL